MRRGVALLLPLALLFAGCLGAATEEPVETETTPPVLADALAALEAGEPSANVRLLGEWRTGGTAEVAAHGDLLYVMHAGTVEVLNVSDPANVTEVATIEGPHRVLDVKLSDDGKYLFVGDDAQLSGPVGRQVTGRAGGLHVYDVSDPTDAKHVAYQPIGERRGPHMVAYHRHPDGRELLFGANADVSIHEFDRASGTVKELARYSPDLVFGFNRHPEVFDVLYQGWAHDMFPMTEPDGSVYLYVANWDAGLRIVDVTDPASPKELGGWNDFPSGHEGNLHTVATQWIDGRRITVGAVEVGFAVVGGYHYARGTDANVVYVWDTTDPADVKLLASWQNPVEPHSGRDHPIFGETLTSTHNLQLEDGRIYLAHYGMGVWVLDVGTPEKQAAPEVLGYYTEAESMTWDVVLHRGVMFTSGGEGVLSLHFLPDALGPTGINSRA